MATAKEWLYIIKEAEDFPEGMEKLIIEYGRLLIKEQKQELSIALCQGITNDFDSYAYVPELEKYIKKFFL